MKKDTKDESIARNFLIAMCPDMRALIKKLPGPECLAKFAPKVEKKNEV